MKGKKLIYPNLPVDPIADTLAACYRRFLTQSVQGEQKLSGDVANSDKRSIGNSDGIVNQQMDASSPQFRQNNNRSK